ncbi:MAG: hypothetical protein OEV60_10120 [Actinomycetota bacterium]|nr:hypothetical protein [Actinomycetota bacterium]MDH5223945.1 hypothetical protein [Actinomycetota bacterium]MDH5313746.1 hypothetical protein [Actinomycetota bacterium]
MDDERIDRLAGILRQAAETHHAVWAITDGAHDDWATWYSDWLVSLSHLPDALGATPVRSELTHALVQVDRDYRSSGSDQPWDRWYAERLLTRFGT